MNDVKYEISTAHKIRTSEQEFLPLKKLWICFIVSGFCFRVTFCEILWRSYESKIKYLFYHSDIAGVCFVLFSVKNIYFFLFFWFLVLKSECVLSLIRKSGCLIMNRCLCFPLHVWMHWIYLCRCLRCCCCCCPFFIFPLKTMMIGCDDDGVYRNLARFKASHIPHKK